MSKGVLLVVYFLAAFAAPGRCIDENAIISRLRENRDTNTVKPSNKPIKDTVNIFVRSISEVNDKDMTFKVQLTFRQEWEDYRLAFTGQHSSDYVSLTDTSLIWTPDLFFSNAFDGQKHKVLSKNDMVRIFPNGKILYSSRISLSLFCPMDLMHYPFDTQTCSIKFASYAYTEEDLIVQWKEEGPVQIVKALALPKFDLKSFSTMNKTSVTNTGGYSTLYIIFSFQRIFNAYWIKVYIPTMCLIIISYLAFWAKNTNVKYLIALLTLLTAGLGIGLMNETIPEVGYTKAIDIWTGICLTFMLATLVLVVVLDNCCHQQNQSEAGGECLIDGKTSTASNRRCPVTTSRFEKMVRVVYPMLFATFTLLYFIVYGIIA